MRKTDVVLLLYDNDEDRRLSLQRLNPCNKKDFIFVFTNALYRIIMYINGRIPCHFLHFEDTLQEAGGETGKPDFIPGT